MGAAKNRAVDSQCLRLNIKPIPLKIMSSSGNEIRGSTLISNPYDFVYFEDLKCKG